MSETPTIEDLERDVSGKYTTLIRRKIGQRYFIAHICPSAFVFGLGVQRCSYGLIWFWGPFSWLFSRPVREGGDV